MSVLAEQPAPLVERMAGISEVDWELGAPLAPWTSVRIGGAAELLARPRSVKALVEVLRRARAEAVPVQVLGGGANTLVGDGGVPGVTVKLAPDLVSEEVSASAGGGTLTLSAGAAISRIVQVMKARHWVGAECLAGIPGTVGGAVRMNAGTKAGECMRVVEAVELATADGVGWVAARSLAVGYRRTQVPPHSVITRARFRLPEGDTAASEAVMDADLSYRKRTQPLSQPNFGSVFKNPPGRFAGHLIEQVGLKGHTVGQAQISGLHANWIVNLGGASAKDVVTLMALAQSRVRDAAGVELEPEVQRMGRFL